MSGKVTVSCRAVLKEFDWMRCICTLFDWFRKESICVSRYGRFPTHTKTTLIINTCINNIKLVFLKFPSFFLFHIFVLVFSHFTSSFIRS